MTPLRHGPDDPALPAILTLMRDTFAYMDGLVDPPSSIQRMTLLSLKSHAQTAELWTLGRPLEACAILTPKPHALYIGKLCVMPKVRGLGLSRRLVEHASQRAKALDLPVLELETRIELVANHSAFKAMGFVEIGRTAHAGFAEPTAITFQRAVSD